jgi:predicted metalloprotease with PDZ domain
MDVMDRAPLEWIRANCAAGAAALLVLGLAACAGARAAPAPPEPEPTLTITPAEAVHYTLELLDPDAPLVAIHVEVVGDADGTSEFMLAEGWAGVTETGRDLELVEARGATDLLASERVNSFTWRVRHAPNEPLALVFELARTQHRESPTPPEYYLPILEPGLLHALGAQALPAPTHLDGGRERPITLAWTGFAAAGWRTLSSFGEGEGPLETTRALDAFRHALFLAGDLRLERRELHGHPLWISIAGEWNFSDDDFRDLTARIVLAGREFFADFEQPYYLVSLIQVGSAENTGSLGGTGLTDSFALFLTRESGLKGSPGRGGVDWLLAHELFHAWNGNTITLEEPEELGYWFSEGFTDFYARRLLQRNGLLDERGFVDAWNEKLTLAAANPERHAAGERVRADFWKSRAVGEVPYQRGDLIALFVDHAIQARSGGRQSLDDLMRALVRRSRAGEAPFTSAELADAIGAAAGPEVGATVLRWALQGDEPSLPPDALGAAYELVPTEVATFDTGFDHEASLTTGTVAGVRPGGCAERAGLRDGMQLRSWSVHFGAVQQPIEIAVREGGEVRKLSYLPQGPPVSGYHLQRRAP